jgi:hypothetical protein
MDKETKKPKYEVKSIPQDYIGARHDVLLCAIANELAELNENLKHFQKHGVGVLNLP